MLPELESQSVLAQTVFNYTRERRVWGGGKEGWLCGFHFVVVGFCFLVVVFWFVETGFHCVALAVLELIL